MSGFYKTVDGVECCLPVVYDASSKLYKMHYGLGNSADEAKWAAEQCISQPVQLPATGMSRRRSRENQSKWRMKRKRQHWKRENMNLEEQFEQVEGEMEVGLLRSDNPRLNRLKKLELHRLLGHRGHCPECSICNEMKAKRRVRKKQVPELDPVPGRTWNLDSIYWSHRARHGEKYTVAFRDESTGYIKHFHVVTRDAAGAALVQAIKELRSDPELNNPNLVQRIILDPAGEWAKKNAKFNEQLQELSPPVELGVGDLYDDDLVPMRTDLQRARFGRELLVVARTGELWFQLASCNKTATERSPGCT